MMSKTRCALFAGALSAVVAGSANAGIPSQQLQMNFAFTASGTLNGVAFSNAAVTFTLTGDTGSRQSFNTFPTAGYYIADTTVPSQRSFNIAGMGQGAVNSVMTTASYNLFGQQQYRSLFLGSSNAPTTNQIFIINVGTNAWDMSGVSGPASGSAFYNQGTAGIPNIDTTLGTLHFTSVTGTATFSATSVPAPGAVALIGLVGAVGARRRRA